jgi:hypothetical protein
MGIEFAGKHNRSIRFFGGQKPQNRYLLVSLSQYRIDEYGNDELRMKFLNAESGIKKIELPGFQPGSEANS